MRTSGYSSDFVLRLLVVAGLIAAIMFAGLGARAGAAGNDDPTLRMLTQAIVVDESRIVVDPAPSTVLDSSGVLSFEAMQFFEQNLYPAASASEVTGPIGRLQTHSEAASIAAPQSGSRSQYHYLDDNLDIASAASVGGTREDYHYLNDEVAIAAPAPERSAARYDYNKFLSDDYVDNNSTRALSSGAARYDHNQFLSDDYVDNYSAAASRAPRYDEIKFLEDNAFGVAANVDEADTVDSVASRLGAAMAERDRIQFFEDNWLYAEPESGDTAESADTEKAQVSLESQRDWIQFQEDNWNWADGDYPALTSSPDEVGLRP